MATRFTPEFFEAVEAIVAEHGAMDKDFAEIVGAEFGEKTRAVIAAVKRAGIPYKRVERKTKTGEKPVTKEDLVKALATKIGVDVEKLDGLDKATKTALEAVLKAV